MTKKIEEITTTTNHSHSILTAIDACNERRYAEASEILTTVSTCVIRTRDAGVHFGQPRYVKANLDGTLTVGLVNCRRIWSWEGANTLTEIALYGPKSGKISETLPEALIPQVIEILPCSPVAIAKLASIKWS